MNLSSPEYFLPPLIAVAVTLSLLVVALLWSRRDTTTRIFSGFLISMVVWNALVFIMRSSPDTEHALPCERAMVVSAMAAFVFYYHFTLRYTNTMGQRRLLITSYSLLAVFAALSPTNIFIKEMVAETYGYAPVLGLGTYILSPVGFLLLIGGGINLLSYYRISKWREERIRIVILMIAASLPLIGGLLDGFTDLPPLAVWSNLLFSILCTVAILKYHLLDIRVALRKGLVYLLVSAVVAAPYVGILLLVSSVFGPRADKWWVHAVMLLFLAIILRPLYGWAQNCVDRLFYRDTYSYLRALEQFSRQTQSIVDIEELTSEVVWLVSGALRASSTCLLLPVEGGMLLKSCIGLEYSTTRIIIGNNTVLLRYLQSHGDILSSREFDIIPELQNLSMTEKENLSMLGGALYIPVKKQEGELAGLFVLGEKLNQQPYSIEDKQLLTTISNQVAMVLENAGLYNEVQHELAVRIQAEKIFQTISLNSPAGIYIIQDGKFVFANTRFLNRVGVNQEELFSTNNYDFVHPGDREKVRRSAVEMLKGVRTAPYEYRILNSNGEIMWIAETVASIQYQGKRAVLGSALDITEHKHAEESLRESEEKYRSIVEMSPDGIITTDVRGIVTSCNATFTSLTGLSGDELLGMYIGGLSVVRPSDIPVVTELFEYLLTAEGPDVVEWQWTHKDGTERIGEFRMRLTEKAGVISGFQLIVRDITERRRTEEEHRRIERLESVGTLAGGIGHDFNNLLTGIMGNISLARSLIIPDTEVAERLLEAEEASLRARDLTEHLLTFARGREPLKEIITIGKLIRDSATFALRGSKSGCAMDIPDNLWRADIDRGQINEVMSNLVINADEAVPEGGVIHISARNTVIKEQSTLPLPKGDYVKIVVKDNGIGIPEDNLMRIFEPYFTTKEKGSGLGLATTSSIIRNHDGYISVDSKPGAGTTFHIYLPATRKLLISADEVAEDIYTVGTGRILVMDDEDSVRKLVWRALTKIGYEVELSGDGANAIEKYIEAREAKKPFDAVILDLTVPGGMGGKNTIKRLLEIDPTVKAVASSGYSTDRIMSNYAEYGFTGVVAKPYRVSDLRKALRNVLARRIER